MSSEPKCLAAPSSHNRQNHVSSRAHILNNSQLRFSIKSLFSPFHLRLQLYVVPQEYPALPYLNLMHEAAFPSFRNQLKHLCFHKILSEHPITIHCSLIYILSRELYVISIIAPSLSCYHSCVVHVEIS